MDDAAAGMDIRGLKAAARDALMEMLLAGKVSAGDLIKLVGMEEPGGEGETACRDFLLQIRDE